MMDVLMIAILLGCFGLVKAFADFCDWQIKPKEKRNGRYVWQFLALTENPRCV